MGANVMIFGRYEFTQDRIVVKIYEQISFFIHQA